MSAGSKFLKVILAAQKKPRAVCSPAFWISFFSGGVNSMRSEVERSVHGQDEDLEKKNDEAYLGRHPSEFTHLVQRHVFSSRF